MSEHKSCCRVCSTGLYSCHWRGSSKSKKRKHGCCWLSFVTLVSLLALCWMYICLVAFNDREDMNWKVFSKLKRWVNWFMVLIIIYSVITTYCVLLLLFALLQVALGERLDLHWLHKLSLFIGVTIIALGVMGISIVWRQEWPVVPLSLQITAPFLQLGAVGALTLLSSFVFHSFHRTKRGLQLLIAVVFVTVSAVIFLCPLYIHHKCPCLIESELPDKPKLFGHRGAPMLAPENTMMSFRRSISCGVTAFETDVQISKDRIPFLMHDQNQEFLLRTTNVKRVFPNKPFNKSTDLTWEELQSLNAGEWFLETDPFHSVSQLSEEEKATARNQTIPSLRQLLNLAQQHNVSVIFDIYSPNSEDTKDIVNTILQSDIDPSLILWLPPEEREYVNLAAPGFIQFYNNKTKMFENGGNHLNVKYSLLGTEKIRELRRKNVTVNLWVVNERWLFSLLWCAGASSVTTNSCHLLRDMNRPDFSMRLHEYKIIWILVDIASVLIMIGLYIFQWTRRTQKQYSSLERERTLSLLTHNVA
ncbi:glycerophosphoinositol inositolphosphodiesterase GDPD2 isoform X2 [Channa argus]|uniref:glycerophosphoinositol inositolphosphodiesterase GDPD2 isoform X2 n=1 Tax=Channa argus TaxID=215402 RepID=UPI003521D055